MRRLVCEYYDGFSFGNFVRNYPELRGTVTDLLIGDLFTDRVDEVWGPMESLYPPGKTDDPDLARRDDRRRHPGQGQRAGAAGGPAAVAGMASPFRYSRRVQFAETDLAGIVHFSWMFRYMEEAEHAVWRAAGLSIAERGGALGWPRVAAAFEFRNPCTSRTRFEVIVRLAEVGSRSLQYEHTIVRGDVVIGSGRITTVCVQKAPDGPMRATEIPAGIRAQAARGAADVRPEGRSRRTVNRFRSSPNLTQQNKEAALFERPLSCLKQLSCGYGQIPSHMVAAAHVPHPSVRLLRSR